MFKAEEFGSLDIERDGAALTVRIRSGKDIRPKGDPHWELGEVFSRLRADDSCRVIILTGFRDGNFCNPGHTEIPPEALAAMNDPHILWHATLGLTRLYEAITQIEKPVVARVNGDAFGLGSSFLFACDLAVALEDARIRDDHIGMVSGGPGVVPGDGGVALVPSHMSPMKAKEYLMLAKEYTGRELAAAGVINAAVTREQLDPTVNDLVQRLLGKSAYALAWTKRAANAKFRRELQSGLDLGAAYEMVNFYQFQRNNWKAETKL